MDPFVLYFDQSLSMLLEKDNVDQNIQIFCKNNPNLKDAGIYFAP